MLITSGFSYKLPAAPLQTLIFEVRMKTEEIDQLCKLVAASGLLADPQMGEGFVFGRARLSAANVDINVNLDPESDEGGSDVDTLISSAARFLLIGADAWHAIIEAIAEEVEVAVGGAEVIETTDLRDDLAIRSVVVFADTILLSFAANKQFPDSWIRVQLGEGFEVEDIIVDDRDDMESNHIVSVQRR